MLCTPLCYVNVCTLIERYRARVTWDYSIRTRIVSYLASERELCVHQRAAACRHARALGILTSASSSLGIRINHEHGEHHPRSVTIPVTRDAFDYLIHVASQPLEEFEFRRIENSQGRSLIDHH